VITTTREATVAHTYQRLLSMQGQEGAHFERRPQRLPRIVDRDSGEVICQVPAVEMLRVTERLEELTGRLIQQQV